MNMALGGLFNTNLFNTRPLNMTFGGTKIPTCAVMFFWGAFWIKAVFGVLLRIYGFYFF